MIIVNNKIELTHNERKIFIHELKAGVLYQLHNDKMLSFEQINQILENDNNFT